MSARLRQFTLIAAFCCALGAGSAHSAIAPTAAVAKSGVVKKGDSGPVVKQIQRKLGIPADGDFGPGTERAVKRFQRKHRLTADGVVGPATLTKLGLKPTAGRRVQNGGGGSDVRLPAVLRRIAQCESGGNPRAVSADGTYRGKFQFSRETWKAMGGKGDPAKAPEAEQDRRALKLYRLRGTAPWANCA